MSNDLPANALQLRSLVSEDGTLELSLTPVPVPQPGPDQVVVRMEAAPINPSDLGLLFGAADLSTVATVDSPDSPRVTATVPPGLLRSMSGRIGQALAAGNEGAGTVVAAGTSDAARALLGKTVAVWGGGTYAQYRATDTSQLLVLPDGVTAAQGASVYVNPMTALGMVETMRLEGHQALVHTAAASNLGQMLVKICLADGIALVNIVRRPEQADLLRSIGATHVCDASSSTFMADLIAALTETSATIAFDATGGGELAGQILTAMEAAALANATEFSRYGSDHLQAGLHLRWPRPGPDHPAAQLRHGLGRGRLAAVPVPGQVGPEGAEALRDRVAAEITTTFASSYTKEISLADMLSVDEIAVYAKIATGQKYLVDPSRG